MVKFTDAKGKTHNLDRKTFIRLMKHLSKRAKEIKRMKAIEEMKVYWN